MTISRSFPDILVMLPQSQSGHSYPHRVTHIPIRAPLFPSGQPITNQRILIRIPVPSPQSPIPNPDPPIMVGSPFREKTPEAGTCLVHDCFWSFFEHPFRKSHSIDSRHSLDHGSGYADFLYCADFFRLRKSADEPLFSGFSPGSQGRSVSGVHRSSGSVSGSSCPSAGRN